MALNINLNGVEATANKSTNVNTDQASNTKYPSVKAVYDWAVGLFARATRTISTTSPLSGGGDLSADRTLSISQSNTTTNGYLSSTDWNKFNNRQEVLFSDGIAGTPVTGGTSLTNSLIKTYLIPANTLGANAFLNIYGLFERVASSTTLGTISCTLFKNTTNSLTGATRIASFASMNTSARSYATLREMYITGGLLTYSSTGAATASGIPQTNFTDPTTTFNVAVDNYLIFAVQLANASDTGRCKIFRITSYE